MELIRDRSRRRALRVTPSETRDVLPTAAQLGLTEWQRSAVRARQLEKLGGKPFSGADEYRRGDVAGQQVEKAITSKSLFASRELFPEISQPEGIVRIMAGPDCSRESS